MKARENWEAISVLITRVKDYLEEDDKLALYFDLIKKMYFDVNPVDKTGVKSCMYPYHEIKRVLNNILNPKEIDEDIIYLGVEALGWLWLK
jgi:hypothetical protein